MHISWRPSLVATLAFLLMSRSIPSNVLAETTSAMSITKAPFGSTSAGQAVDLFTLRNERGITAKVITYGAIIYSMETPDSAGHLTNITANCQSVADYENRSPCFGALLGRYANRIAKGRFTLDGQTFSLPLNGEIGRASWRERV